MTRLQMAFGGLVLTQAAHSVEEYVGRLWESFPPARFLTGLISQNLQKGFLVINILLFTFGVWCFFWPLRRHWKGAFGLIWLWVGIGLINGIGHPLWSLIQHNYTPGLVTAPVLLIISLYIMGQLISFKKTTTQY